MVLKGPRGGGARDKERGEGGRGGKVARKGVTGARGYGVGVCVCVQGGEGGEGGGHQTSSSFLDHNSRAVPKLQHFRNTLQVCMLCGGWVGGGGLS